MLTLLRSVFEFVTVAQILCHIGGDFVSQTHWMASRKRSSFPACFLHATCYASFFLILTTDPIALAAIGGSHFLVDRYAIARWILFLRGDGAKPVPEWCVVIIDQFVHVVCNGLLLYLRIG